MIKRTCFSALALLLMLPFALERNDVLFAKASDYPKPFGTETVFLRGYFSGLQTNQDLEENQFFFNDVKNTYEIYKELKSGDYFYPFDRFKQKPFYWDKGLMGETENMFTANGLKWYSKGTDDGYWFVEVSGTYHISITYLIENTISDYRTVWNEEYGSFIEFACNNNKSTYFLLDDDSSDYYCQTNKEGSLIYQYGYGVGTKVKNTSNISMYGFENKTIVPVVYDSKYSEYVSVTKMGTEPFTSNNILLDNFAVYSNLEEPSASYNLGRACAFLSGLEFGLSSIEKNGEIYEYYIMSLTQPVAERIMRYYSKMSKEEKNIVSNSEITITDKNMQRNQTVKIGSLISTIKQISIKKIKTSIWTFLIPAIFVFASSISLLVFLGFKRKNT